MPAIITNCFQNQQRKQNMLPHTRLEENKLSTSPHQQQRRLHTHHTSRKHLRIHSCSLGTLSARLSRTRGFFNYAWVPACMYCVQYSTVHVHSHILTRRCSRENAHAIVAKSQNSVAVCAHVLWGLSISRVGHVISAYGVRGWGELGNACDRSTVGAKRC